MGKPPKKGAAKADTVAAGAIEGAGAAPDAGEVGHDATAPAEALDGETVAEDGAAPETPPAPGDDAETVFQRRLDRLNRLVEDADFESGTALGDLVECVVDLFKHRPAVWSAMSQGDQRDLIRHVEGVCKKVLSKVVLVVAQEDSATVEGTLLGQFTVKGETIEAKLKLEHTDEDVMLDVYKMAGHKVVIISADDKRFSSQRGPVATMPDQPALEFEKAPNEIRTAPPGDTDLAGEEPLFRVVDNDPEPEKPDAAAVYLEPDGVTWSEDPADAGSWPETKARELAETLVAEVEPVDPPAEDPTPERTHDSESAVDDEESEKAD